MGDSRETRHLVDAGMGSISAVVATLPAGYTLGESRVVSGIKYRLFQNTGGSTIGVGSIAAPISVNAGPYSVSVSTASKSNHHIGACVVKHAAVATTYFFWGAVRGEVGPMVGDAASIPTASYAYVGDNGTITLVPASALTGAPAVVRIKTTVSNGGTASGNAVISFPEA